MENTKPHISVVIPVYNCADCLYELYNRLVITLDQINSDFEIIFVNDASPQNDWKIILELAGQDSRVKGINLSRNFGQHNAITAGLDFSTGEWIVVMDGDLQDQPEEILKLYQKAQDGFQIVFGRRFNRQDNYWKKQSSKLFYWLFSYLTDTKQDDTVANYGIYHRVVIDTVLTMKENLRYFPTAVRWVGFHSTSIDILHSNRNIGMSSYSFKKRLNLALDVILAFSDKPLRIVTQLGVALSLLSFVYAIYIFFGALLNSKPVAGWSSLMVSIWFLSGIIISILGLAGMYICKTFNEVKNRPIYVVGEIFENKNNNVST